MSEIGYQQQLAEGSDSHFNFQYNTPPRFFDPAKPRLDIRFPIDPQDGDPTESAIRNACQELAEILIGKRRDYGRGNIERHGARGILIRIDDKLARLENLLDAKIVENEPVADSWRDLAGYAVIGKLFSEGKW